MPRSRRAFLKGGLAAACSLYDSAISGAPLIRRRRPQVPLGVQSGDVTDGRGVVWCKSDRPSYLLLEWDTTPTFRAPRRVHGPLCTASTDFTGSVDLGGLPPGQTIFYRICFEDAADARLRSERVVGRFRSPPARGESVLFTFGGDTAGQGYGINPAFGGMRIYESMRRLDPDFFIHGGDQIYADNPIPEQLTAPDGTLWRNLTTPAKLKVAETLDEFRGCFAYNLLDENVRAFNAQVSCLYQWDDHEVRNNWWPGQVFQDPRYRVRDVDVLSQRARQAMLEYTPMRLDPRDPHRIYRSYRYGPHLEVFVLDERSYRGRNSANRQEVSSSSAAFLGNPQLFWLKQALLRSTATWKVIASDMPFGLVINDGRRRGAQIYDGWANNDPWRPRGRELELGDLLRHVHRARIRNLVVVTADVHYAAAHHYDPRRASVGEFTPFWEFVAGPLNAGTYGPEALDGTFGPEARFVSVPSDLIQALPPSAGYQFFGSARIDGRSAVMTVRLHDLNGKVIFQVALDPER